VKRQIVGQVEFAEWTDNNHSGTASLLRRGGVRGRMMCGGSKLVRQLKDVDSEHQAHKKQGNCCEANVAYPLGGSLGIGC